MNLRKENSWQVWPLRIGSLNFAVTKRAGRPSGRQETVVRATAIGNTGKITVLPKGRFFGKYDAFFSLPQKCAENYPEIVFGLESADSNGPSLYYVMG